METPEPPTIDRYPSTGPATVVATTGVTAAPTTTTIGASRRYHDDDQVGRESPVVDVVLDNLDLFVEGLRTTVSLTLLSYAAAFVIGIVVAACRVSPVPPLRAAGAFYVGTVRNTPLAVLMVLFYVGLPDAGIIFAPFQSAVIVLSAYTGAFIAETVRSGVNAVAVGQGEAARALGLTFPQTLRIVVLPQALRTWSGPLGSLFIALIKNSALAALISVNELAGTAEQLISETAQPLPIFLGVAVAYLLLTLPAASFVGPHRAAGRDRPMTAPVLADALGPRARRACPDRVARRRCCVGGVAATWPCDRLAEQRPARRVEVATAHAVGGAQVLPGWPRKHAPRGRHGHGPGRGDRRRRSRSPGWPRGGRSAGSPRSTSSSSAACRCTS